MSIVQVGIQMKRQPGFKNKPVVEVRHRTYQPNKKQLKKKMHISASPEQLAEAVMRDITLKEIKS